MKNCPRCKKEIHRSSRKKYCSESCKYWFNSIRKDKEKHLPPVRKRTANFFSMVIGSEVANSRGQGRRSGGTIKGAMSARIECTIEAWTAITKDNLQKHFKGIRGYTPVTARLGDGRRLNKVEILREFNIKIG